MNEIKERKKESRRTKYICTDGMQTDSSLAFCFKDPQDLKMPQTGPPHLLRNAEPDPNRL